MRALFRRSSLVAIPLSIISAGASAQIVATGAVTPEARTESPGGVDMRTGAYVYETEDISIGEPDAGGIAFIRLPGKFQRFTSNWSYSIAKRSNPSGGSYYQIENRAIAKSFYSANGTTFSEASIVRDGASTLQIFPSGSNKYFVLTSPDATLPARR